MGETNKPGNMTIALQAALNGDRAALNAMMPVVYAELHEIAEHQIQINDKCIFLQPTALISEAFLKFCAAGNVKLTDRKHFFAIAAIAMKQVLIEYFRRDNSQKRKPRGKQLPLSGVEPATGKSHMDDAQDIYDAWKELESRDKLAADIVTLRLLCGFSESKVAKILSITEYRVRTNWSFAARFLYVRLFVNDKPQL